MENNWGAAPQQQPQQGAQWPGAAGYQPALGPYAAYGGYPMLAAAPAHAGPPRAYPMLAAAPALAPPPPPRAAPRAVSAWLDGVKAGYGAKYASVFEDLGVDDEEDVQN
jgi:hypothetical protein